MVAAASSFIVLTVVGLENSGTCAEGGADSAEGGVPDPDGIGREGNS